MKPSILPVLDPRRAEEVRGELLARRPAYLPEWTPGASGPDAALLHIASRYAEAVIQRLNQAPEKHRMAFFDLLGLTRIPAQASRVPIVFQLTAQAADAALPAGSRLAAPPPPESTDQIVFETERAAGLASARLRQVASLWPGRDQWIDHSANHAAGLPFRPFKKSLLQDTPHAIYIAHDTLLALAGKARVDVRFDLVEPGSEPLSILWEYWDGEVWRGFKEMRPECAEVAAFKEPVDGTLGLTRSGRFRLESDCAESQKFTVAGIEAHWIRGRLVEPLPPDPAQVLPRVDDVRVSVQISRALFQAETAGFELLSGSISDEDVAARLAGSGGLEPDKAFSGAEPLDTSKAFFPLGQVPKPGDTLYLSSQEIFSKPGAEVIVSIRVAENPEATIDKIDDPKPELVWEYWDGSYWRDLGVGRTKEKGPENFQGDGAFQFRVPADMAVTKVNDVEALWVRARLHSGGYSITAKASFQGPRPNPQTHTFTYVIPQPPVLAELRFGYTWEYGPFPAEHVLTHNDFQYLDRTEDAKWPGRTFLPFDVVSGATPALYLG
ncbi:MAG TPA: putative baseplate assembly protein, partial [Thermoanaerobaculia bacterium]|nr:putative baseplate assembly protein [Thermoanaerobaculia bacterium]